MSHAPQEPDEPHGRRATLFETERGRVAQCACCGCLELRFGNALIALQYDELDVVLDALVRAEASANSRADDDARRRETVLYISEGGCGWVFSQAEAVELHRLVAGARLLLDLQSAVRPDAWDAESRDSTR